MKTKLKMALMSLCAILVLSLSSCGSKVNQEELNKKIEAAIENEGLMNASFNDAEYEFMAQYVLNKINDGLDKINDGLEPDTPDTKESEILGEYMMILGFADHEGKLKGDAKKIFVEVQNKFQSMTGAGTTDENLPDFSEDTAPEVMEAVEVAVDDTDTFLVPVSEAY